VVRSELLARLVAGYTNSAAAQAVGITPRTLQLWRKRAYSTRPEDQPFVEFERALQRGLLAAAEVGQPRARDLVVPATLDELLADLA
jgi:hypothetical protein